MGDTIKGKIKKTWYCWILRHKLESQGGEIHLCKRVFIYCGFTISEPIYCGFTLNEEEQELGAFAHEVQ